MSWDPCLMYLNDEVLDKKVLEATELDCLKGAPFTQHFCNTHCGLVLFHKTMFYWSCINFP